MTENAEGNSPKNWSTDDTQILEHDYGRISKKELKRKLPKKSWEGIRHKAQRGGVSYYNNGNGVTAQSLAESFGVKPSTVRSWLKKRKIPKAKKIDGRKWDARVEDESLQPVWVGTRLHKQDAGFLNRADLDRCYSCNNHIIRFHGSETDDWCSRRCYQDYKHYASQEKAFGRRNPMFIYSPHLRPNFQDWMLREEFWTRLRGVPDNYLFPTESGAYLSPLDEQIKWIFSTNVGRILDLNTIRALLSEDAEKYGLAREPVSQLVTLQETDLAKFVDKLNVKNAVTIIQGGGLGIGVYSPYNMTQIVLIRQLQQKNRAFVRMDHLALNLSEYLSPERELDLGQTIDSVSDKLAGKAWEILYRRTVANYGGQGYVVLRPRLAPSVTITK